MIPPTILKWLVGAIMTLLGVLSIYAYIYHKGEMANQQRVIEEQHKAYTEQVELNTQIQKRLDIIASKQEEMRKKQDIKTHQIKEQERKLISEDPSYYSTDVLDDASLQHIQSAQRSTQ